MFNLQILAEFIAKSRMQKTGMAVYFWTTLLVAKLKLPSLMNDETFAQTTLLLIIAAFGGNVLEHFIKARYPAPKEAPKDAPVA